MKRFCLFSCLLLLLLGAPVFSQVPAQLNATPDTAASVSDSLANQPQPAPAQSQESGGEAKLTIDTLWKMTEQAGGLRWVIYLVFVVGVGAIIFKSLQLWFDARYTRPFIKQRSEAEEAALEGETRGQTLKNLLENKIKSSSPDAIVGLAARHPKSIVAQLLKTLGELATRTQNAVAFQEEISGFVRREKDRFELWRNFVMLMSDTAGALGLLGTVWGMYQTFIGGDLQPEQILSGMGIALVTTLLGLIVSICLNIFSTGVVKIFSKRLEILEFAGDTFRARFAETDVAGAALRQPAVVTQPVYATPPPVMAAPDETLQRMTKKVPTKLVVIGGENQSGEVSTQLPKPIEVQVLDQDEDGLAKQRLIFETNGSDCSFGNGRDTVEVSTDSRGRAKVNVVLGKRVGEQSILIRLDDENGASELAEEVRFVSRPGPPSVMTELPGSNHQTGLLKEKLPVDLGVRLQDRFGNPIVGTPVSFRVVTNEVIANSGRFSNRRSEIEIETDDQGTAMTPFWLGEEVGPNVVRVTPKGRGGNAPELLFYATGKES